MPLQTITQNDLLNKEFGGSNYTPPSTFYFALMKVMPNLAGAGGVECSETGYARTAVLNNTTNFPATSTGVKTTGTDILFPTSGTAGADWAPSAAPCVGVAIYDAASGGNIRATATFTNGSREILTGDIFTIKAGTLKFRFQ